MQVLQLDYFFKSEAKLDESFPANKFHLNSYDIQTR